MELHRKSKKMGEADLAQAVLLDLQLQLLHLLGGQALQRQLRGRLIRQLPCQDNLQDSRTKSACVNSLESQAAAGCCFPT